MSDPSSNSIAPDPIVTRQRRPASLEAGLAVLLLAISVLALPRSCMGRPLGHDREAWFILAVISGKAASATGVDPVAWPQRRR